MHKGLIKIGSLMGALSVILGAFAAHGLKEKLSVYAQSVFETAVRYQFYHSIAILLTAIIYKDVRSELLVNAGRLFFAGIIIFSGSLYFLALNEDQKWLGAITPVGGVCFIAGWLLMFYAVYKEKN